MVNKFKDVFSDIVDFFFLKEILYILGILFIIFIWIYTLQFIEYLDKTKPEIHNNHLFATDNKIYDLTKITQIEYKKSLLSFDGRIVYDGKSYKVDRRDAEIILEYIKKEKIDSLNGR